MRNSRTLRHPVYPSTFPPVYGTALRAATAGLRVVRSGDATFRLAVLVLGAMVAIGAWLAIRRADTVATPAKATGATTVSEHDLLSASVRLGRPVYWAGREPGKSLELTETSMGRVYVRYLPPGVAAGADTPYLTIGTYPMANAYAATAAAARKHDSVRIPVGAGGVAFYSTSRPTSVYEAFRGTAYQVEVYSPTAAEARGVVEQRLVRPAGGSTATHATAAAGDAAAATPRDLSILAGKLGRAVFWAGTKPATTMELTDLSDGRVYVRYLPAGVDVGAAAPYLTVATYPLRGAYAQTRAAATRPGAVKIPVPGAIAFYSPTRPTSVYLAFKGSDEQVEVFDPSPAHLRALIAADEIEPAS